MISILVPTRGRPVSFARMVLSAFNRAANPKNIEVVAYVDDDDSAYDILMGIPHVKILRGERVVLSKMWNLCWEQSAKDLGMLAADDLFFKTSGWDEMVLSTLATYPDRIVYISTNDVSPHNGTLGTHGFLSKEWVEASGYFVPPYFSSDMNDVWITEVAKNIDRYRYLEAVVTEHMHYSMGKMEKDDTAKEREVRGRTDKVVDKYHELEPDRRKQEADLRAAIKEYKSKHWPLQVTGIDEQGEGKVEEQTEEPIVVSEPGDGLEGLLTGEEVADIIVPKDVHEFTSLMRELRESTERDAAVLDRTSSRSQVVAILRKTLERIEFDLMDGAVDATDVAMLGLGAVAVLRTTAV